MRQKSGPARAPAEQVVKDIRRATRRHFSAEDKIRIVLEGLRGEASVAEPCRREGIVQNLCYRWSKDFLEAGKKRLAGDTAQVATTDEVKDLRREANALKGQQREADHTADGDAQDADQLRRGQLHKQCVFHDSAGRRSRRPAHPTSATGPTARSSRRAPLWGCWRRLVGSPSRAVSPRRNLPHRSRNARRS